MIQLSKVLLIFLISFQLSFAQSVEVIRQNNAFEIVSQKLVTKLVTDSVKALQKFIKEPAKKPEAKDPLSMALYERRLMIGDTQPEISVQKSSDTDISLKIKNKIYIVSFKNLSKGILWVDGHKLPIREAQSPEYLDHFMSKNFPNTKFSFLSILIPNAHAGLGTLILLGMAVGLIAKYLFGKIKDQLEFETIISNTLRQCQYDKSHLASLPGKSIGNNETVKFISYINKITNKASTRDVEDCDALERSFLHRLNGGAFTDHCKQLTRLDKCLNEVRSLDGVKEYTSSSDRSIESKDLGGSYKNLVEKSSLASER